MILFQIENQCYYGLKILSGQSFQHNMKYAQKALYSNTDSLVLKKFQQQTQCVHQYKAWS